jgi:putative ABC transport system permease protein
MGVFLRDIRYAARMFAKNPAVSCVMVLSLALAIGANTAIFSVVYGVLLRPLPYRQANQIVAVKEVSAKGSRMNFDDPNFEDLRDQNHTLQALAEYSGWVRSVTGGAEPTRTMVADASADFFDIMGVSPVMGRGFGKDSQRFGGTPVALVSYSYWQQYLGSLQDLSGSKLTVEKRTYSVVGVLPAGFRFPTDTDIWIPRELSERYPSRTAHNWRVIGRMRDGVSVEQARADLSAIAKHLHDLYGKDSPYMMADASVTSLQEAMVGKVRSTLFLLLGAVAFLLLVACANVANLMLVQAASRARELAIRAALGAGRNRLVRQFLTEALLLSFVGGTLGVFGALWGVDALLGIAPNTLPRTQDVSVNLPVMLFALGICVLVAAGLGVLTAVRATSAKVQTMLGEGSRGQAGSLRSQRIGRTIVASQLAITLILLIGAGLLGRSLYEVLSVDYGFRTENIVSLNLPLSFVSTDAEKAQRAQLMDNLITRLQGIPGVESVGVSNELPLSSDLAQSGGLPDGQFIVMNPGENFRVEDLGKLAKDPERTGDAEFGVASEGFFQTLGIPLVRGRLFDNRDGVNSPQVAVISQSLVDAKWPHENPIGKLIEFGNMDGDLHLVSVVGVVGDIRNRSLDHPPTPTVYMNYRQRPRKAADLYVVIRTTSSPASVSSAAREIARDLAPDAPPRLSTVSQIFSSSLGTQQFNLILMGAFAGTALLLAMAGIYGVMAYTVEQRTREFGVRMALGAQPQNILSLVLRQGIVTIGIGVAAGVFGAIALTHTMASLLYHTSATDPITFAGVALLLTFIALLASYLPARRATRVDPVIALRYE